MRFPPKHRSLRPATATRRRILAGGAVGAAVYTRGDLEGVGKRGARGNGARESPTRTSGPADYRASGLRRLCHLSRLTHRRPGTAGDGGNQHAHTPQRRRRTSAVEGRNAATGGSNQHAHSLGDGITSDVDGRRRQPVHPRSQRRRRTSAAGRRDAAGDGGDHQVEGEFEVLRAVEGGDVVDEGGEVRVLILRQRAVVDLPGAQVGLALGGV